MTESWEREFEVARIAHGDLNATIQTMLKEDYTIEEASYVLYDDADLIKAVLADPNWSDRILKNPLPPGVPPPPPPGHQNVPGSHAIHDTRMNLNVGGATHNINAPEFGGGHALSRIFGGAPSERHRKDLTSWFGRDALESAGIQPKEGFMSRLKSGQEMRNARRAAKRAQPGWFSTLVGEGTHGLRRRRQLMDAIDMARKPEELGYNPATQGRAGDRAATLEEAGLGPAATPAALPAPTEAPIEAPPHGSLPNPGESTSEFEERMTSEAEQPPADGVPVESPATEEGAGGTELPFWATGTRGARGGGRLTPKIKGLAGGTWERFGQQTPATEGMTFEDFINQAAPEGGKAMSPAMRRKLMAARDNPEHRKILSEMLSGQGHQFPFMQEGWEPPQEEEAPMSLEEANETLTPTEADKKDFFGLEGLLGDEAPTEQDDLAQQVKDLVPQEDTSTETPDLPSMEEALEPKPDLTGQPVEEKKNVGLLERGKAKQAEQEAKKKPPAGEFDLDLEERPPKDEFFRLKTSSDSMDMAWDHLTMLKRYE